MPDKFSPLSLTLLLKLILKEYRNNKSILGIPSELFFHPRKNNMFGARVFNQTIDTPIGVAAGPHTQLAQNIVAAWLMGARYIELKTVQTLDELEIPKPCIDMQDEGYNCEWSQELKIKESFEQYLNAWIIIHILNHELGIGNDARAVFNMSAGYNMQGLRQDNIQWFFAKMNDCSVEISEKLDEIRKVYPSVKNISIPACISDNITISTMHGCPANEIEEIAAYFLTEKRLHTLVKLNPTLLGAETLRELLNVKLRFNTLVPDSAFEHDLKYHDALKMIASLDRIAAEQKLQFGIKLSNTLESVNNKNIFDPGAGMMYMSGRALHPLAINLADKLRKDLESEVAVSFSAGVDAFNICDTLACGFQTVTVCSDLLKPGGYMRLHQYFENMEAEFKARGARNTEEYICKKASVKDVVKAAAKNLSKYSAGVADSERYKRLYIKTPDIKTGHELGYFDCIFPPCQSACATNQDIPEYLYEISQENFGEALNIIIRTNPFPSVTGMVCDHLCQGKCTRINYDSPVQIREVKRYISGQKGVKPVCMQRNGKNVAIIGAGPSGLACAFYLALAGFALEVFEAETKAGGMVRFAIPGFRIDEEAIEKDLERIKATGIKIHYSHRISRNKFEKLQSGFDFIYIASGAGDTIKTNLPGSDSSGVKDALEFLRNAKEGWNKLKGKRIVIIGGGNTAMDAARTAMRLAGKKGKVRIIYRRTMNEMPADETEIKAALAEGVEITELVAPEKIIAEDGEVKGLLCSRMKLEGTDDSGRKKPVKIEGSTFEIPCDVIFPALGQIPVLDFIPGKILKEITENANTGFSHIFIGGDAKRNASTAIVAIADGRKAAEQIIKSAGTDPNTASSLKKLKLTARELIIKRAKRVYGVQLTETLLNKSNDFEAGAATHGSRAVVKEASRCLYCNTICNICTTVCPNFANRSYTIKPLKYRLQKIYITGKSKTEICEDEVFEVKQQYQIINLAEFCNDCGNCSTFCPTASAPYKEKPKVYLTATAFILAGKGYFPEKTTSGMKLFYLDRDVDCSLTEQKDKYIFESEEAVVYLKKADFRITDVKLKKKTAGAINLRNAAEMSVILKGVTGLL